MNPVLVDSSVWIDYFRGSDKIDIPFFENLLDTNQICTNNLILSELIPFLRHQKHEDAVEILQSFKNIPIEIIWEDIVDFQTKNLKNGINKVGIPDLIIMQNVINNSLTLYSLDKHFVLMSKLFKFHII
jgi:predicted nucleic acid-binding protein